MVSEVPVLVDMEVLEEDMELPVDMEPVEMVMALEVTVMLFWVVTKYMDTVVVV